MRLRIAAWIVQIKEKPALRFASWGLVLVLVFLGIVAGFQVSNRVRQYTDPRSRLFLSWSTGDQEERAELITVQRDLCPAAPFVLPTDGYIGLLYGDPRGPYSTRNPHQGLDIFSITDPGLTPVYAAYPGYITREDNWRSALIQRIPDDPLHPGRQIWLYYTHMADVNGNSFIVDAFPPGTQEVFVEQGTLIGYTGDFNGEAARGVWVHLHFSIVLDNGLGGYSNELDFENTVDPSAYLGMTVNYGCARGEIPACTDSPGCESAVLGKGGN